MSQSTSASTICFYAMLLEVSQHGGGAYRVFTSPFAIPLCFSVPVQGTAFSSPGVRRQRKGTPLFYYLWALHALAKGLCAAQVELNKLSHSTTETWSLPEPQFSSEAQAPHLLPLMLSRPWVESMSPQAGARCLGWVLIEGSQWGGTAARGAVPAPVQVPVLQEPSISHSPAHALTCYKL